MTTRNENGQAVAAEPAVDLSVVAGQLVEAARAQGVELTGPGGLLTGLTRQVLETALEVELTTTWDMTGVSGRPAETCATAAPARRYAPMSARCGSACPGSGWHVRPGGGA
jgi:hypothetical protein